MQTPGAKARFWATHDEPTVNAAMILAGAVNLTPQSIDHQLGALGNGPTPPGRSGEDVPQTLCSAPEASTPAVAGRATHENLAQCPTLKTGRQRIGIIGDGMPISGIKARRSGAKIVRCPSWKRS